MHPHDQQSEHDLQTWASYSHQAKGIVRADPNPHQIFGGGLFFKQILTSAKHTSWHRRFAQLDAQNHQPKLGGWLCAPPRITMELLELPQSGVGMAILRFFLHCTGCIFLGFVGVKWAWDNNPLSLGPRNQLDTIQEHQICTSNKVRVNDHLVQ